MVELVNHWLHSIKTSTAIMCTSLITRLAASVDPHAANTIIYITTSRIMINESHLSHSHMIKRDETSSYLTRISLCIIPHHSPSPSLRGKEDAGALFHAGTHGGGNKKSRQNKQQGQHRQHNQHHPHSQHSTLHHQLCQGWDRPLLYLHPNLPLGTDKVWDTFRTPTRLEV